MAASFSKDELRKEINGEFVEVEIFGIFQQIFRFM